jgi:hypothetical protein
MFSDIFEDDYGDPARAIGAGDEDGRMRGATFVEETIGTFTSLNRSREEFDANVELVCAAINALPDLLDALEQPKDQGPIAERARNHLRALEEHEGSCSCADCAKHAESAEIIEALLSQPKDQASPSRGWKMVPREPTKEMLEACQAVNWFLAGSDKSPEEIDAAFWSAMYDAAPSSLTSEGEGVLGSVGRKSVLPPTDADGVVAPSTGWKLVPTKHDGRAGLTHDMCEAFWAAYTRADEHGRGHYEATNAGYNAMLHVAPEARITTPSSERPSREDSPPTCTLIEELCEAAEPIVAFLTPDPSWVADSHALTQGSSLAKKQITAGDIRKLARALSKAKRGAR